MTRMTNLASSLIILAAGLVLTMALLVHGMDVYEIAALLILCGILCYGGMYACAQVGIEYEGQHKAMLGLYTAFTIRMIVPGPIDVALVAGTVLLALLLFVVAWSFVKLARV